MLRKASFVALALVAAPLLAQDGNGHDPRWQSFLDRQLPIQWNWLPADRVSQLPKPTVVPTATFKGFDRYVAATEAHAKGVSLGQNGELLGYVAGMPFPGRLDPKDPQVALKVMWNYDKRYLGDDFRQTFKLNYVNSSGSITRWLKGERKRVWFVGRVALDPTPAYPWAKEKNMRVTDVGELTAPSDEEGKVRMGVRYLFDDRLPPEVGAVDDQWVYLPAIRRVRRLTGAQREDPLFGSTIITDEVVGGNDRETLVQTFKLIGETSLWVRPIHWKGAGKQHPDHALTDLPTEIEKRPVWIIEAVHKNPKYIFSKMHYYVDQEMYIMHMTESFDRKGQLWKRHFPCWKANDQGILINYVSYDVDLQSGRGTLFELDTRPNQGISPDEVNPERLYRK